MITGLKQVTNEIVKTLIIWGFLERSGYTRQPPPPQPLNQQHTSYKHGICASNIYHDISEAYRSAHLFPHSAVELRKTNHLHWRSGACPGWHPSHRSRWILIRHLPLIGCAVSSPDGSLPSAALFFVWSPSQFSDILCQQPRLAVGEPSWRHDVVDLALCVPIKYKLFWIKTLDACAPKCTSIKYRELDIQKPQ